MNNTYINKNFPSADDRCLIIAEYIIEEKATVRAAAKKFGLSKSTIHKDITVTLKRKNLSVAKEVRKILETNKMERHLRGGEATKKKYINAKAEKATSDNA